MYKISEDMVQSIRNIVGSITNSPFSIKEIGIFMNALESLEKIEEPEKAAKSPNTPVDGEHTPMQTGKRTKKVSKDEKEIMKTNAANPINMSEQSKSTDK